MSTTALKTDFTPEDLLAMEDADRYELIDGRLSVTKLREEDELSGEDVIADFRCRVGAIFPPQAEVSATS